MEDQTKNLILATVLSFLVILAWFVLFPPEIPEEATEGQTTEESLLDTAADDGLVPPAPADQPLVADTPAAEAVEAPRVTIDTPSLQGSFTLRGGRIDDLLLKGYRETLDEGSDLVRLFSPTGTQEPYFAMHSWVAETGVTAELVPSTETVWSIESGETLTPETPVTLVWDNGAGLIFRKTISVDESFMFSITQSVENTTGSAVSLRQLGEIRRLGQPDTRNFFILHEGLIRMSDGELEEATYDDLQDFEVADARVTVAENGWLGFTDKYWMATLVEKPGTGFLSIAGYEGGAYRAYALSPTMQVAPGETASYDSRLYAGAKEWEAIRGYQNEAGIDRFLDSIDWGWFFFLTKPIFALLHWLNGIIGNMGWAIIALTVLIKAILLPLAFKSYVSMAKMKELQPEMEKLKERAGDDRQAMQQGMMELYKKNKVNPASGCLPILLQIPIFFSLYKVIFVTLELRHAPWIGWIRDLSAPDPSSIMNLFGLLPWDAPEPGSILALIFIGVMPITLGVSMWLQQKLNPAPTDATQKMIFAWMPWVFMFMLGGFASGLVLYWITNNTITFIQQYAIMRSQGYTPDVLGNIRASLSRGDKSGDK